MSQPTKHRPNFAINFHLQCINYALLPVCHSHVFPTSNWKFIANICNISTEIHTTSSNSSHMAQVWPNMACYARDPPPGSANDTSSLPGKIARPAENTTQKRRDRHPRGGNSLKDALLASANRR